MSLTFNETVTDEQAERMTTTAGKMASDGASRFCRFLKAVPAI